MFLPLQRFRRQTYLRETAQDGCKDNFCFQSDQWGTDAKMDASAKAKVSSLVASNVKTIRVREAFRVAVGRTYDGVNQISFVNLFPFNRSVLQCRAIGDLYGTIIAKYFFNGRFK